VTIKWVKVDPLVMSGEPFCYGTRLTVRQLLELRRSGYDPARLLREHAELRMMGIAQAYRYAGEHRDRYAEFFGPDGALLGPGFEPKEAASLPPELRLRGLIVEGKGRSSGGAKAGA
jgi:uncharacterized protein (DUF433 family)